jgi:hypothetical protein
MAMVPFPMPRSYTPGTATSQGKKSGSLVFRKPNYFWKPACFFFDNGRCMFCPGFRDKTSTGGTALILPGHPAGGAVSCVGISITNSKCKTGVGQNTEDNQAIHDRTQNIAEQYCGLSIDQSIDDPQDGDPGVDGPCRQGLTAGVFGVRGVQLYDLGDCCNRAYQPGNDHHLVEFGFPPMIILPVPSRIDPTLIYNDALNLAYLENPKLATRYLGRPVRIDRVQEVQKYFVAVVVKRYDRTDYG